MPNDRNVLRQPIPKTVETQQPKTPEQLLGFKTTGKIPQGKWATARLATSENTPLAPGEGFAVHCGRNNLVVVDIDSREARAIFRNLWVKDEGTSRVKTTVVKTPRGHHFYFNAVDGHPVKNSVGRLAKGIDIRTAGGYVIAPPTVGYDYLLKARPQDLPLWIANQLSSQNEGSRRTDSAGGTHQHSINGIMQVLCNAEQGQRNATLYWCLQRVSEMPANRHRRLIKQISREASHLGLPAWEIDQTIDSVFGGRRG